MSIIGSNILAGASGQAGYNLNNSLRFRSSASANLTRTFATGGTSRQIQTCSLWVKRGILGSTYSYMISAYDGSSGFDAGIQFLSDNLSVQVGGVSSTLTTTQLFRDPSAWYHIVVAIDTTQATAANRVKVYVNGNQVTAFSTSSYPAQNSNINFLFANGNNRIGTNWNNNATTYFDGYMTEINFIDGQQLTPSSFGETSTTTGTWIPKAYSGSYGTNGFKLNFSDTSAATAAAIGKDSSGNGNNWTPSGISVTAGVTYDAMIDVPTNTSATVANYAVLSAVDKNSTVTMSNGNLQAVCTSTGIVRSTIGMTSGKWYWETIITTIGGGCDTGLARYDAAINNFLGATSASWGYNGNGNVYNNNASIALLSSYTTGDVIGIAFDADAGKLWFAKNNTWQASGNPSAGSNPVVSSLTSAPYFAAVSDGTGAATTLTNNFGAGSGFTYTAPTGFVALNTYNLSTPTILKGNLYMDATLYTGTGASLAITNAGAFQPDFVWVKGRSGATDHALYDSVRGTTKDLVSNSTAAETTQSTGLTAFGTGGFTVGALAKMNTSAATYVGWQWQAGQGTTSSDTSGSITSTVSVNTTAGFSVVTYSGNSTTSTIGHGLGVTPAMFIVKRRNSTGDWYVYHKSLGATQTINLDLTSAAYSTANAWANTAPTSSVFTVSGVSADINNTGGTYVAYCWAEIAGFSAFGSYTGNGSADGPFIYTGFQPKFVMVKRTDSSTGADWFMWDSARLGYNVSNYLLFANLSQAEYSGHESKVDLLSNGFKIRDDSTAPGSNASGGTYIFMAFASNPFKNSLAR